ncbi:hypothetical protein [Oligella sp. HMSC09E12]|uniref:hypothetical protein n=1 Tax=Oligella sp. HMSC09E12 TaxID=1581147 RepID=UPI0008A560DC|nr:hypothetical protein [Oligella sp. HMSC09E12]OFV50058.1 hypothetical protein HMPREF3179_03070 [Oligella sp. HMSC09E12]
MRELNRKPALETALRAALSDPSKKAQILEETGWHDSMPSKVLSGDSGITLDKLDRVLSSLGLVIVSTEYMNYLAYGNEIGTHCACARAGFGVCGTTK